MLLANSSDLSIPQSVENKDCVGERLSEVLGEGEQAESRSSSERGISSAGTV